MLTAVVSGNVLMSGHLATSQCVKDLQHTRQEVDVLRQQVHDLQERCKQLELHHHHVLPDHYHVHQK